MMRPGDRRSKIGVRGMRAVPQAMALAGLAVLAGCATIVEGPDQRVAINTSPSGAQCAIERNGELIATAAPTPHSVVIRKTSQPIQITCEKPGFQTRSEIVEPDAAGWSIGNIVFGLIGAPIGLLIDSTTGALNKYDANITMALWPSDEAAPPLSSPQNPPRSALPPPPASSR